MVRSGTLLEMKTITKDFPGVRALDGIQFELGKGEVHALVGENGAGKSTLMLILGGVHRDYEGTILLNGEPLRFSNPGDAIRKGIGIIYQELDLTPEFTVGENIFLGSEPYSSKLGVFKFIERERIFKETQKFLEELGFKISPKAKVSSLSVGEQQLVQIAKAIRLSAQVLVMDEPTARLAYNETETLFKIIETLKRRGIGIIYISHHMEEILKVADRVTVLRDGKSVGTLEKESFSLQEIIRMVVGKELAEGINRPDVPKGEEVLSVKKLSKEGAFENISFSLREGEILGFGGLVGSGRTEIAECVFGDEKTKSGEILVRGKRVKIRSPLDAIKEGIVLVPEDRKAQGIIPIHSVSANLSIAFLRLISKYQFIKVRQRERIIRDMVQKMAIKTPNLRHELRLLSGGNQQKVVIGKWLCTNPQVFILDQPTRGIDIGAKQEIYRLIGELARNRGAVILISDELPELLGLADRIIVMRRGRIKKEFLRGQVTQSELLATIISDETGSAEEAIA
jgi:ribose transport system ATP-binding protein